MAGDNNDGKVNRSGLEKEPAAPTSPMTFRVRDTLRQELEDITDYERALSPADLVRTWINEKVASYHNNKRFLAFQAARHPKGEERDPAQVPLV